LRFSLGILLLTLAGWLGGCSSGSEVSPVLPPLDSGLSRQVKNVQKKQDQFSEQAGALLQGIGAFREQAGWKDLAPLLKSARTGPTGKPQADLARILSDHLQGWGTKWSRSPAEASERYLQLVERSSAIEEQRKSLVAAWADVQAKDREQFKAAAGFSEKNADTMAANSSLIYEMNRANLNRFGLDEFGLFAQLLR
jgi:hypothetical protein